MNKINEETHDIFTKSRHFERVDMDRESKSIISVSNDQLLNNFTQLAMNSVAINKKLHDSILEKEYLIKTDKQDLNTKMGSMYRQMEDLFNKTQGLYQQTVRQNQKARFLTQELIKPFKQQLRHKVDETTFSLKMKMMVAEFDNMGHRITYDRKGVIEEDSSCVFDFIRKEIIPLINSMEKRMEYLEGIKVCQQKQISDVAVREKELENSVFQIELQIHEENQRITKVLNSKCNIELVQAKLQAFEERSNQMIVQLNQKMEEHAKAIDKKVQHSSIWLKNIQKGLIESSLQNKQHFHQYESQLSTLKQNISQKIRHIYSSFQDAKKQGQIRIQQLVRDINKQNELNQLKQKEYMVEMNKIKQLVDALSTSFENRRQDTVSKGLLIKINKIESEVKALDVMCKTNQKMINHQDLEIISIKNLLSQKANFSDFIRVIQKKADKQDYKELKNFYDEVSPTTAHFKDAERQLVKQSEDIKNQLIVFKSKVRKSLSSRKNIIGSPSPLFKSAEKDESLKKYMLGLDNSQNRKAVKEKSKLMYATQSERRKWNLGTKEEFESKVEEN